MANQLADLHVHISENIENTIEMFDAFADYGVTDLNILGLTYIEFAHENNLAALYYKEVYNKLKIRVYGGLYYDQYKNYYTMPFEKQAEELLDMGCDGIKLLEEKPNYRRHIGFGLDSKIYDKMFDMLEERNVPIVSHVADPETFWDMKEMTPDLLARGWFFGDRSFLTKQEIYDEVFRRLDRNPKLRMVMAHFFFLGFNIDEAERVMDKYPNVGFDLAPGGEMFIGFSQNIDKWHDFFVRHADRIYYGTDCTSDEVSRVNYHIRLHDSICEVLKHDTDYFKFPARPYSVRGLALDADTRRKICYDNYFNFSGTELKPLNRPLFEKNVEEVIAAYKNDPSKTRATERLNRFLSLSL